VKKKGVETSQSHSRGPELGSRGGRLKTREKFQENREKNKAEGGKEGDTLALGDLNDSPGKPFGSGVKSKKRGCWGQKPENI